MRRHQTSIYLSRNSPQRSNWKKRSCACKCRFQSGSGLFGYDKSFGSQQKTHKDFWGPSSSRGQTSRGTGLRTIDFGSHTVGQSHFSPQAHRAYSSSLFIFILLNSIKKTFRHSCASLRFTVYSQYRLAL